MNLINQFTKTLGYYCSINQFVELSIRFFSAEVKEELENRGAFQRLAERHRITLTSYEPLSMMREISLSYIVHIHLCFEGFLQDISSHVRKYGYQEVSEKRQEESWLSYAERIILISPPKEITPLIELCEYYRLVRNTAVHTNAEVKDKQYQKIKKYNYKQDAKFARLSAPNEYENISFDDFVMFARTCNDLANVLYSNLRYDYTKIVLGMENEQIQKLKKYTNSRERGKQALLKYIATNYKCDSIINQDVDLLYESVLARSSNR